MNWVRKKLLELLIGKQQVIANVSYYSLTIPPGERPLIIHATKCVHPDPFKVERTETSLFDYGHTVGLVFQFGYTRTAYKMNAHRAKELGRKLLNELERPTTRDL